MVVELSSELVVCSNKPSLTEDHATKVFSQVALPLNESELLGTGVYVVGRRFPTGAHDSNRRLSLCPVRIR